MNQEPISQEQILSIPLFNIGFASTLYRNYLGQFTANVNEGSREDAKVILHHLIDIAVENCGISKGFRTVAYDFAYKVLADNTGLWTEEEKEDKVPDLFNHWLEFYHEDPNDFKEYDIACLTCGQYFLCAMNMLDGEIQEEYIPAFSYAAYIFFKNTWSPLSKSDEKSMLQAISDQEDYVASKDNDE